MSSTLSPAETRPTRGQAREALLFATLEVIASGGLDAVTHRRVAEVAGVSPGSATYHFSSREDLIRSALAHYMDLGDTIIDRLDAELRSTTADPKERVTEVLCGVVDQAFAHEGFVRAEYELILFASSDEELAADIRRREARWAGYLAADLEEAGVSSAVEIARILINLTRGFDLERLTNPRLRIDDLRRRLNVVLTKV